MSLYGALFTGVTGLNAQGQKIAIISDNISNVNTVGYKESSAQFQTLVVNATSQSAYSPGGVRTATRQNVDKQGIITSTSAPTDVAISGNGMFVVNASSSGSGQVLYTRSGSFRQDNRGNLTNAQGFFLQGWPLDTEGRLPGEVGNANTTSSANLSSLETVNVEDAGGTAQVTTAIDVGLNLDAAQAPQQGAGMKTTMDSNSIINDKINATTIIAPDEPAADPLAPTNSIRRGDAITVQTISDAQSYDYTYGGFVIGRSVLDGTLADTDSGSLLTPNALTAITPSALALSGTGAAPGATSTGVIGTGTMTLELAPATIAAITTGTRISFSGIAAPVAGVNMNTTIFTVSSVNTGTSTVTLSFDSASGTLPSAAGASAGGVGSISISRFGGNMFDATSTTQRFISNPSSLSQYTTLSRSFKIANASLQDGTSTFTYTSSSPNTQSGQFNSLTTLAEAINNTVGLSARVVDGRLLVGGEDASGAVTFSNVDAAGDGTLAGIDWVKELGLIPVTSGSRRFSTLDGLAKLAAADEGLGSSVADPLGDSTLEVFAANALEEIRIMDKVGTPSALGANPATIVAVVAPPADAFDVTIAMPGHSFIQGQNVTLAGLTAIGGFTAADLNTSVTITSVAAGTFTFRIIKTGAPLGGVGGGSVATVATTNYGSILAELGVVTSLANGAYRRGDTGNLGPAYDASGVLGNSMSSGSIAPHFSRSVTVYDSLGAPHDMRMAFLKLDTNQWAVEYYASDAASVSTSRPNGQITSGVVTFNGDGSVLNISTDLTRANTIVWTNGSLPSTISLDLGNAGLPFGTVGATTIGDTSGLSQFDSDYNVSFFSQNGAPVGDLVSVSIDEEGFVVAVFSNGETKNIYKLPIADFANPNGLTSISGNVFSESSDSGDVILREAGKGGAGDVVSNALEASNVDLAEQLTDMIVAQRAYQSNTRVIRTADELLEQLTQL